jgi:asparagine synthase (glutamine-hydrolysing)
LVTARTGTPATAVSPLVVNGHSLVRQAATRRWLPDLPADAASRALQDRVRVMGLRRAITGVGGDWVFGGSPLAYADFIRRGRFVAAWRRHRLDRRTQDSGWTSKGLLTAGLWPALPDPIRAALRQPARRVAGVAPPPWLRLPLTHPSPMRRPARDASFASAQIGALLSDGWIPLALELYEQSSIEAGCEVSHPLLDRRLVEFALSLPEDQRRRGVHTRDLLRRAAAHTLPGELLQRTTKADFGHVVVGALQALGGGEFFRRLTIAERGWVDGPALAAMHARVIRNGAVCEEPGTSLPILWTVAAVELWSRSAGS